MTRLAGLALAPLLTLVPHAAARPAQFAARIAGELPMLPVVSRVHIDATKDHVLVLEDVNLERDEWRAGDLDLYVAFGAPGAPRAFDARLIAVPDGAAFARLDDAGTPVEVEQVSKRPPDVEPLLGRSLMAGAVLHLDEEALRHAFAPSDMAVVRVRTLLDLPEKGVDGAREIVVRLGTPGAEPLALRRVELATERRGFVARGEASLCGPEADPWPLSLHLTPAPAAPSPGEPAPARLPIAPGLALRHASDDLCVRFWTDDEAVRTSPAPPATPN